MDMHFLHESEFFIGIGYQFFSLAEMAQSKGFG